MATENEMLREAKAAPLLLVQELSATYFAPISLALFAGELLCLFGASGSGKSQFLRALADLSLHRGAVFLQGVAQQMLPATEWRRKVAYLPAESGWWAKHVGEHFATPPKQADVKCLGLPNDILLRPLVGISSGERQRLGLLRLLQQQPRVILLDEPSANLDLASTLKMEQMVRDYLQENQAAAIWVSHDPAQRQRLAGRSIEMPAQIF